MPRICKFFEITRTTYSNGAQWLEPVYTRGKLIILYHMKASNDCAVRKILFEIIRGGRKSNLEKFAGHF